MYTILYCFVLWTGVIAKNMAPPLVTTSLGELRGTWSISTRGRPYADFQGIPYAVPPVGSLRFKEPEPARPWTGVKDASKSGSICLQYHGITKTMMGSEDCLYMNIYTPFLKPERPLPVLVFIHSGAYLFGTGNRVDFDPSRLMDWDLIIVTINYRLGALGFLSTGDHVVPGNNGLKDQSLALHWIKNNIQEFGGDKDSITLSGSSAGSSSVHYHCLSHMSRDTFTRAFLSSGSAFNPWAYTHKPTKHAKKLATLANCSTTSSQEMIDCLTSKSGEEIIRAQSGMYEWADHLFTPFVPTAEPLDTKNAFLTKHPLEVSRSGDVYRVPIIVTFCAQEGLYPAAYYTRKGVLNYIASNWEQVASDMFKYNDTIPESKNTLVASMIKYYYFEDKPISEDTFPQLIQALSDRLFINGIKLMAEEHVKRTRKPTYLARYSFRGNGSFSFLLSGSTKIYGTSHGDDLIHILPLSEMYGNADDVRLGNIYTNIFYTFMTSNIPKVPGVKWLPVNPNDAEVNYLEISSPDKIKMNKTSDIGPITFWNSLHLDGDATKFSRI
ncbi:unnamed protein product [Diatraea saccharalis]|uniref:Carboxylic ester hydrolase n=1 Tax=Diatraea saccharalis TaxID=40085 RepID=A0A9P0FY02_9NEOP|nr:unnamed protein product [Diatraea saccharalis]